MSIRFMLLCMKAPHMDIILGADLGNEDNGIGGNTVGLTAVDVVKWSHTIYNALHRGCNCTMPIVPGTGDNSYLGDSNWPFTPTGSAVYVRTRAATAAAATVFGICARSERTNTTME